MHADAREELGQLVRAFRLYLERQARAGAYSVSAAPMPPAALADDAGLEGLAEDLPEAGTDAGADALADGWPEAFPDEPRARVHMGQPTAWKAGWPEAFPDEPRAADARREDLASQRRPPARPPLPSLDEPVPSFEAALAAVLDEPPSRSAPQRRPPPPPAPSAPQPAPQATPRRGRAALADVRADLGECVRCKLAGERTSIVFGTGDPGAALMFIGEAPGYHDDQRGEPFVGPAGELLDLMIQAMGWTRDTVYITSVLKCRPPDNRDPQPDEVAACQPFLARQIDVVAPRLIVTLGEPATRLLLQSHAPLSALRGHFQEYRGIRVMPTYHPAFLLPTPERPPSDAQLRAHKRDAWNDLKLVIAELERLGVPSPRPPKT